MTFQLGLCEDAFDRLGCDNALRHAYRVYVWRQTLSFLHHSRPVIGPPAGAKFCSEIQALSWSKLDMVALQDLRGFSG
jgi:hypothetical protein